MNELIIRVATVGDDREVSTLLDASYSTLLRGHYKNELLIVALPLMTKANPHLLASGIACGGDLSLMRRCR